MQYVSETYWILLEDVSTRIDYVLKTSWGCLDDVFASRLEEAFKTFWRRLEDVTKMSWRRLENVLKTCSQNVLKMFGLYSEKWKAAYWAIFIVIIFHSVHGLRHEDVYVSRLEVSSLTCRCVFYRPELNAKGDPIELNFEGLDMKHTKG